MLKKENPPKANRFASGKKTILIIILLAFTYISNAQKLKDSDVPTAVKTAFVKMYPSAISVEWEMENSKYEAEFKESGAETSAIFEANGTYVQTDVEIAVSSLPGAVSQYVTKNLKGEKIKEATKITDAKGTITYEAEVGGKDYIFDASGVFLKIDSDGPDDKDEDDKK